MRCSIKLCIALGLAGSGSGHRGSGRVSAIIEAGGFLLNEDNKSNSVIGYSPLFTRHASTPEKLASQQPTSPTPAKGVLLKPVARELLKLSSFMESVQSSLSTLMSQRQDQSSDTEQLSPSQSTVIGLSSFTAFVLCLCCCCAAGFENAEDISMATRSTSGSLSSQTSGEEYRKQRSFKRRLKNWLKSFSEDVKPSGDDAALLMRDSATGKTSK